jgi:hypothetical protein
MEEDYLSQTEHRDIDLVVCSDGEAILGIGDQGVGVLRFPFRVFVPCADARHRQLEYVSSKRNREPY